MGAEVRGEEVSAEKMEEAKNKYEDALRRSFDHHDTKQDQRLDKDETAVFLTNLVGVSSGFMDASVKIMTSQVLKKMLKEMNEALADNEQLKEHLPQLGKILEEEFKK